MLFAAYAATLGIDAGGRSHYTAGEARVLLGAESIASDHDLDLADDYAGRAYAAWYPGSLRPDGQIVGGRRPAPQGIGLPLLVAPAYALGGPKLVELLLAVVAALAFVLGAALARRVVPDPWATWAALLAGLSPPVLAHATAVAPALPAGALLAGAALCALAVRERPIMRAAFGGAALLALLPWLDPWLLVPAAPVAALLARWTRRRGRGIVALGTIEIQLASLVFYVSLNDRLYGGFTPLAALDAPVTGASSLADYASRVPRLASVFVDRDVGLLRWAPVLALAFPGVWLLVRSRRERLSRLIAEQRDAEHAAFLVLTVCTAQVAVALLMTPGLEGAWFPGRQLVPALPCAVPLVAWGLRHAPRVGAVLAGLTVAASGWLLVALWTGSLDGWAPPSREPPWVDVLPASVVALAFVALACAEWWRRRRELRL